MLSVNPSGPTGTAVTANPLLKEVRLLQERARELREEDVRIEKVQSGTRKRRRCAGPTAGLEGKNDAEDGQVHVIINVATNGPTKKRKRPHAVQETSWHPIRIWLLVFLFHIGRRWWLEPTYH